MKGPNYLIAPGREVKSPNAQAFIARAANLAKWPESQYSSPRFTKLKLFRSLWDPSSALDEESRIVW